MVQPPPASTVRVPSRSRRNARSAAASALYRMTCAPVIIVGSSSGGGSPSLARSAPGELQERVVGAGGRLARRGVGDEESPVAADHRRVVDDPDAVGVVRRAQ